MRHGEADENNAVLRLAVGLGAVWLGGKLLAKAREEPLDGRVVLITGGSRGLGLAMAREFGARGARLAICARSEDELGRAREDLESRGAEVVAVPCDVRDRHAVEGMVGRVTDHYGRVDILVNNAGVISAGPAETVTIEDFEEAMAVMFWGTVYATWAALPQMRERRSGRIVNITSIGGKVPVPHLLSYSAAKYAATGFSEGLRSGLRKDGIWVTTVTPGLMRTGSYLRAKMKGDREKEFSLFGAIDNLPIFSVSAESAARQIVAAARSRAPQLVISPQARLMALAHGVFPGAFADLMGISARFLPEPDGPGKKAEEGRTIEPRLPDPAVADPLGLGRKAAEELNQR